MSEPVRILIKHPYLEQVKAGLKTLEARANYPNLRGIKAGQEIRFQSGRTSISATVVEVRTYPSIERMLEVEDHKRLIPGSTKEEALRIYKDIYPDEKVQKNKGMRVFEVEVSR